MITQMIATATSAMPDTTEEYVGGGSFIILMTQMIKMYVFPESWNRVVPLVPIILSVLYCSFKSEGDWLMRTFKGLAMGMTLAGSFRTVKVITGNESKKEK